MGSWNDSSENKRSHLNHLVMPDLQRQYSDMKGRELIVSANQIFPFFVMGRKSADGTILPSLGLDFMILDSLSAALNFT